MRNGRSVLMDPKFGMAGETRQIVGSRRRPVQTRAIQTREHIVEATAQVLARVGYSELSTNAVAERAGIGIGTLYRYFADKEDLVAALRSRTATRLQLSLDAAFLKLPARGQHDGARGAAIAVAGAVFEAVAQEREMIRLLPQEAPGDHEGSLTAVIDRALAQIVVGICYLRDPGVVTRDVDRVSLVIDVGASAVTTACMKLALADYTPEISSLAIELVGEFITTAFTTVLAE